MNKTDHRWNRGVDVPPEMNDHPVSQAISMFWDGGDPWGSAMAEGFALCDFVTSHLDSPDEIPAEMGFRQALAGPDTEDPIYEELVSAFEFGDFTAADAFDYLPIVHDYIEACRAAGLDY